MQLAFDPDFDLGAWPGPRQGEEAVAGQAWVGPEGLLALLETELGLGAPHTSESERIAALVPRLFERDRFFGVSARVDPWATGMRLLQWRERLWEHGWRGEGLGQPRLNELAEVTLGLAPGRAERLEVVAGRLENRRTDVERITILVSESALSPAWRQVIDALERRGTSIVRAALSDAPAHGNLQSLRDGGRTLSTEDLSVQLYRPNGPREGARMLAATLAADSGFGETVFISPDGILDEALAEFGLPTLGGLSDHRTGALAELLPMTIGLAWSPVDPQLAYDWLSLPDSVLPRRVARELLRTLEKWPAAGNPQWSSILDAVDTEEAGAGRGVRTFFEPLAERDRELRVRELVPRIALIQRWAEQLAISSPAHREVLDQCITLRRRFEVAELARVTAPALDAVLASVVGRTDAPRRRALCGYAAVGRPGGMAGPARRTIWWGFLGSGSQRPTGIALRAAEREALAQIGVTLPSLGDEVKHRSVRSRRPLQQTAETLILVAPRHDESGEAVHTHSLWDEVVGRLDDPRDARHLWVAAPVLHARPVYQVVPLSPLAVAPRARQASIAIAARPAESPTSLSKLIGCSFAYALDYAGRVRSTHPSRPQVDNRLFGQIAHEVFARVAMSGELDASRARASALSCLAELLPTHAALLLLPGHQQDLVQVREAIAGTAQLLGRLVETDGLRIHSVETELKAQLALGSLVGTPDLVLADPRDRLVLLDLKWSGETYRRDELALGTALQLSAYAELLARGGAVVRSIGYVILTSQRVLLRGESLSFSRVVDPALLDATWTAAVSGWGVRAKELSEGRLFAEGVASAEHEPIEEAFLSEGKLSLPAPCGFCSFDLLCGRAFTT